VTGNRRSRHFQVEYRSGDSRRSRRRSSHCATGPFLADRCFRYRNNERQKIYSGHYSNRWTLTHRDIVSPTPWKIAAPRVIGSWKLLQPGKCPGAGCRWESSDAHTRRNAGASPIDHNYVTHKDVTATSLTSRRSLFARETAMLATNLLPHLTKVKGAQAGHGLRHDFYVA